jgi:hypothetical protein
MIPHAIDVPVTTSSDTPSDLSRSPQTKRCSQCLREFPIVAFRFHRKAEGKRHQVCSPCEIQAQRELRLRRRAKDIRDFGYEVRRKRNPVAIGLLCQAVVRKYGGFERLARYWHEAVEAASNSGCHATMLRSFCTLARLMWAAQQLSPRIDSLTEQELSTRLETAVIQVIVEHPVLAVRVCRQLGWQVIPATPDFEVRNDQQVCTPPSSTAST